MGMKKGDNNKGTALLSAFYGAKRGFCSRTNEGRGH